MKNLIKRLESGRYLRWTRNERYQHWTLAISFGVLVFTGFALKYPEAWWSQPFSGIEWLFDLRGLLHRIAGAVFMILGIYHIAYMYVSARGRALRQALQPGAQDFRDLIHNILYYLGRKPGPARFGHFSYMEKAEYLALIWGAIIMGVTGFMLWFEDITLAIFPRWSIDLITVIHLYEAWLATLAIVVWHFYFVIFNPDVYPVDRSMVEGTISEEHLRHHYNREWIEMQESSSENEHSSEVTIETDETKERSDESRDEG